MQSLDSRRMADPKPAYLLQGDDEVKIDGWRSRVRQRAADDPEATLEVFPDKAPAEEVAAALSSMTLAMGRRWMLVEGVERWKDKEVQAVAAALGGLPADTIVVLIATGAIKRDEAGSCARQAGQGRREVRRRDHDLQGPHLVPVRRLGGRAGGQGRAEPDAGRRPGAGRPGRGDDGSRRGCTNGG